MSDNQDDERKTVVAHRDATGKLVLRIACGTHAEAQRLAAALEQSFKESREFGQDTASVETG